MRVPDGRTIRRKRTGACGLGDARGTGASGDEVLDRSAIAAGTQTIQSSASMAATMPWMDMGDISITEKRRRELNEKFGTSEQRQEALIDIRRGRIAAAHAALSSATWAQNKTIMRCWFGFCELTAPDFGGLGWVPDMVHAAVIYLGTPLVVPLLDRPRPLHLHRASKTHHEMDTSSSARIPWRACFQHLLCC